MKQLRISVDFNDLRRNEQNHKKVPLPTFHLNGHTEGFHLNKVRQPLTTV